MIKKFLTLLIIVLGQPIYGAEEGTPQPKYSPIGYWFTQDNKAKIQLYDCGSAVCGKIVALKNPVDPKTHEQKLDKKNPDSGLRTRPVEGLEMMEGFTYSPEDHKWDNGSLYDPKKGETYSGNFEMLNNDTLKLHGYVMITLFGRSQTWHRTTQESPFPEGEISDEDEE